MLATPGRGVQRARKRGCQGCGLVVAGAPPPQTTGGSQPLARFKAGQAESDGWAAGSAGISASGPGRGIAAGREFRTGLAGSKAGQRELSEATRSVGGQGPRQRRAPGRARERQRAGTAHAGRLDREAEVGARRGWTALSWPQARAAAGLASPDPHPVVCGRASGNERAER